MRNWESFTMAWSLSMVKWRILVNLFLFIAATNCDFFSTPQSQLIYEGGQTTLTCHVEGTAFWQLNGTVYSELNTAFFKARGITSFDFFLGGSEVNKTLTVIGSVLNNNTVINCVSLRPNSATSISENATITVLGPPANVSRRVLNSTSVQLSWYESFTPPNVTIERYTVSIFNMSNPESHQLLETYNDEGPPANNGLHSHIFNFDRALTKCTQIVFSVTSTSTIGTSPPSNVTWEMLIDKESDFGAKRSLSCLGHLDSKSLTVSLKPPRLCAFQSGEYVVSLIKRGQVVASEQGSFTGSPQPSTIKHPFTDQNVQLGDVLTASVVFTVKYPQRNEKETVTCRIIRKPSPPDIGGLDSGSQPDSSSAEGLSGEFIAGIFITSIVVVFAVVLIVGVSIHLLKQQKGC